MATCKSFSRLPERSLGILLCVLLPVVGCEGTNDGGNTGTPNEEKADDVDLRNPTPTDASTRADSLVQQLTARYLSYAYRGASLRSAHPLNDSLFALRAGKKVGGPVMLVDTFYVQSESISHQDSTHTVRVRAPTALTVTKVWDASNPRIEHSFLVRIEGNKIAKAPRIVGWSALRAHILQVEAESGKDVVKRLEEQWTDLTEKAPGV